MNPTSETGVRGEGKTKFQARNMPLLHVAWKNVFQETNMCTSILNSRYNNAA